MFEKLKSICLIGFILSSIILIVFFCPVTIHETQYPTANSYLNEPAYYSYEENRPIWNMEREVSYTNGYSVFTPSTISNSKTPKINWGKLLLEELCLAGVIFIIYIIIKNYKY